MKKVFILTGEASGDKLASTVIEKIQKGNNDVKFLRRLILTVLIFLR